jgi:SNF2 family DNA or RNA helicase
MSKLLQICCGVAYGVDGDILLPNGPRTELVREIIEEAEAKVLVFVPFTGALNRIADELRKDFTVAVIDGSTSKNQRDTVFKEFQTSPNPRVLVCNPQTLSHGLTLTAGNTIIWYAPISSNETYQQACARITRPGQKLNTLIVHIEATALEQKLYSRLQGKERVQGVLLQLMKGTK